MTAPLNLTGQRFGKLTALHRNGSARSGGALWRCRCDCGREIDAVVGNLRRGGSKSCGCSNPRRAEQQPDIIGRRFGRLVVLERAGLLGTHAAFLCQCDCGVRTLAARSRMLRGAKRSCGCLQREIAADRLTKHGHTDRGDFSPTYITWAGMKQRCGYKPNKAYKYYGRRGISVCERWLQSFDAFLEDMGERPDGMTIDRIDPEGDYEPGNCRWATAKEQGASKRNSHGHATHGAPSRTYLSWAHARRKCHNPKTEQYKTFGGRGIRMCDEWRESFPAFLADMGERPDGLFLVRIDLNGDFSPANCKWGTLKESGSGRLRGR